MIDIILGIAIFLVVISVVPWVAGKIFIAIHIRRHGKDDEVENDKHDLEAWSTGILVLMVIGMVGMLIGAAIKRIASLF